MSLFDRPCKHCGLTVRKVITIATELGMRNKDPNLADQCLKNNRAPHDFGDDPDGSLAKQYHRDPEPVPFRDKS